MQSNTTFDLYPRGCCALRYFYREARNPVSNVMSDFLSNNHNYQLHMYIPRLQPPSPPRKLHTGLKLPSGHAGSCRKEPLLTPMTVQGMKCLGPNALIPLPIIPAFPDASGNTDLPTPPPPAPPTLALREGMSPVYGHPHQDRQRLCPPSEHWQPAHGQLLPAVTRPLLHFRSRAEFWTLCSRGPGRASGLWDASAPRRKLSQQLEGSVSVSCQTFLFQEGNARLLHISLSNQNTLRLEINSGKTESCSVHSPLDQRIKRNNGVSTLTERQNFSLQSLFLPPMESGKSYLQNILLSMNDFMSCLCVTKSVKCVPC